MVSRRVARPPNDRAALSAMSPSRSATSGAGQSLRFDGFLAAEIAEAFVGLALDVDAVGGNAEIGRHVGDHRRGVRGELGLLGDQRCIDINRPPAAFGQQGDGSTQEDAAVGTLVARIGIGKMAADVAEPDGAKQRVGDGVEQRVGVGMAEQTGRMRYFDAAENQFAAFDQPVHIVALPDAEIHLRALRIIAAKARSAG
jgi:hypothetical protein